MNQALGVVLVILLCVGCSSSQEVRELPTSVAFPTLTQTSTATATYTPSITPSLTPTDVPTSTNTATNTPAASATSIPTFTDSPTPLPTSTITDTPTPLATNTATITPTLTSIPTVQATATLIPTALPSGQTYYANNGDVRVRTCAQRDCDTLIVLQYGDSVQVIGETTGDMAFNSNRWYIVNYQGRQGYVHSNLVVMELPEPTAAPVVNGSSGGSGSNSGAQPGNCSTAVAMGLSAQQAGQYSNLDRDHDGVACYGD